MFFTQDYYNSFTTQPFLWEQPILQDTSDFLSDLFQKNMEPPLGLTALQQLKKIANSFPDITMIDRYLELKPIPLDFLPVSSIAASTMESDSSSSRATSLPHPVSRRLRPKARKRRRHTDRPGFTVQRRKGKYFVSIGSRWKTIQNLLSAQNSITQIAEKMGVVVQQILDVISSRPELKELHQKVQSS